MRVRSLELTGFRAFSGTERFDLDGDAVVVVGSNGQGKTSFFDAILWGLAGTIPRLDDQGSIVSMYSPGGEARVALEVVNAESEWLSIVRSTDGTSPPELRVESQEGAWRGAEAETELLRSLWPQALAAADPIHALCSALQRGVYLQQDAVADFVDATNESERFAAVSELIGAGRVNEVQIALARSRTAWSRATNVEAGEVERVRGRQSMLESQVQGLGSVGPADKLDRTGWDRWWDAAQRFLEIAPVEPQAPEAAAVLDIAVKELHARQLALRRREEVARTLLAEFEATPLSDSADEAGLRQRIENAQREVDAAREALIGAETTAAETRRKQLELREANAQLRAFASLALQHLGDLCPVCLQTYDEPATRARLQELAGGEEVASPPATPVSDLGGLAAGLEASETVLNALQRDLRLLERQQAERRQSLAEMNDRVESLGLGRDLERERVVEGLVRTIEEAEAARGACDALGAEAELLALSLARVGQEARRNEVETELNRVRAELSLKEADLAARERTAKLVEDLLEGLRGATSDLVASELEAVAPLLQRIYAAVDPHPVLRDPSLLSSLSGGRGKITARIRDSIADVGSDRPQNVLSSSQLNVLAVSIFLALNLGMAVLPIQSAILDDPLQSLDDLNLLGLIDVLRRTREHRQLFVSTHDARFGRLLARKLRPVREEQRTIVIELGGWSREGPTVTWRELPRETGGLRIAA